jgi:hypothetical protein
MSSMNIRRSRSSFLSQHVGPLGLLLFAPAVDQSQRGYRHHVGTSVVAVSRDLWAWARRAVTGFLV